MDLDSSFAQSHLLQRICDLVQQVSIGGGVGTSLNHLRRPGVSRAGEGLELWVKHFLAGTINRSDDDAIAEVWNQTFSFHGGTNNPPDAMLFGSIATEVKKTESLKSSLQLNSSWPIRTLHSTDHHITQECRQAEDWNEKPFLFIVGRVNGTTKSVQSLYVIDGRCLSDTEDVYEDLLVRARALMLGLGGSETKEIGKFNSVDARNRTSLRVRPMFSLNHPSVIFEDLFVPDNSSGFTLNVLIPESSYDAFEASERLSIESFNKDLKISRTDVLDPTDLDGRIKVVHIGGTW